MHFSQPTRLLTAAHNAYSILLIPSPSAAATYLPTILQFNLPTNLPNNPLACLSLTHLPTCLLYTSAAADE